MYNKTCITCGSLPVTRIVGVREGYLSFNRKPKIPEPFSRPCKPVTCNFGVQTSCKNSPRSSPGKSGCSSKSSSKPSSKPCSKPSSKPSRKSSCSEEKQPGAITVCPDFCDRSDNSDDGRYNRDNREYRDKLDPRTVWKNSKKREKTQNFFFEFLRSKPSKVKMTFFSVFDLKNPRNFFFEFFPAFFWVFPYCATRHQRPRQIELLYNGRRSQNVHGRWTESTRSTSG